jgi:hypothetical protein
MIIFRRIAGMNSMLGGGGLKTIKDLESSGFIMSFKAHFSYVGKN